MSEEILNFFDISAFYDTLYLVKYMRDFFTYYLDIRRMEHPFRAFSMEHLLFLTLIVLTIILLLRRYRSWDEKKQKQFQRRMAFYFLFEELIYTIWLFLNCHDHVWAQVLPLELCSLCVYINAASVFTQKESLRFFSAVVGLVAGGVAILYPANIDHLYPTLSYRVINFYILHGAFILFSITQLRDRKLLEYHHLKKNTLLLCCMFTIAFIVNLMLKTQYMFVGVPPKISFIASLYELTGIALFLPVILMIVCLLQFPAVYVLRRVCRVESDI